MNTKKLDRLYEHLRPRERARLAVEAMARGDETDLRKLVQTCPREHYTMTEAAYADAVEASRTVVLLAAVDLGRRLARLDVCAAWRGHIRWTMGRMADSAVEGHFRGYEAGAQAAWKAAGHKGKPPVEDPDLDAIHQRLSEVGAKVPDVIGRIEVAVAAECKVMWEALATVLQEELGVDAGTACMAWAEPILGDLERHRETLEAVEADQEEVQAYADALRTLWPK